MSSRASSRCSSVSSSSSYSSKPSPSLGKSKNIRKSRGITKAKHSSSSSSSSSESVVKMLCIRLPTPPQSESSAASPVSSSSNSSQPRSQLPSQPSQPVVGTSLTSLLPSNHSSDLSSSSSKIYWKRKNYLNSQQYIDSLQSLEFDHYHREQQEQAPNDKQLISMIDDDPNVVVSTEKRNETSNTNSNQIAKPCAIVAQQMPSSFSGHNVQQPVSDPVTPPLESDIAWLLRQQTQLQLQAAMLDHLISANPLGPSSGPQEPPQQSLFYLERTWIDQRQLWLTSKFAAIFPNSGTNST